MTWVGGRSTDIKKAFYKSVAQTIAEKGGMRQQDLFTSLVDSRGGDWSFGNGEMQYAPVYVNNRFQQRAPDGTRIFGSFFKKGLLAFLTFLASRKPPGKPRLPP